MCGRFVISTNVKKVKEQFKNHLLKSEVDFSDNYFANYFE